MANQQQVAIVTGGASGIGLGIARRFADDGHPVAMLDVDEAALEREGAALRQGGANVIALRADVSNRSEVEAAYAVVRTQLGPIGIVVANAGISGPQDILTMTGETWQRMIDVNLTGVFNTIQPALSDMVAQKWGRIVTISSMAAQSGAPDRAHYAAAKGGVIGLTKALARELARHGITANTIPPALVDTPMMAQETAAGTFPGIDVVAPMIPISRSGTPTDIANACAFLCSENASYITGQQINVNGGAYM